MGHGEGGAWMPGSPPTVAPPPQDDMQFVIHRQLQAQWQQEAGAPPPVRRGNSAPHGGHFLSFFRRS